MAYNGAMKKIDDFSKEELLGFIQDAAKNWLAHDGLWFQAVERKFGIETAINLDKDAWRSFTRLEGRRILRRLGKIDNLEIPPQPTRLMRSPDQHGDETSVWIGHVPHIKHELPNSLLAPPAKGRVELSGRHVGFGPVGQPEFDHVGIYPLTHDERLVLFLLRLLTHSFPISPT